jgi:hypothetical protein
MLADPNGEIAVILLVNTSLSGPERRAYLEIFEALWAHAKSLRR